MKLKTFKFTTRLSNPLNLLLETIKKTTMILRYLSQNLTPKKTVYEVI